MPSSRRRRMFPLHLRQHAHRHRDDNDEDSLGPTTSHRTTRHFRRSPYWSFSTTLTVSFAGAFCAFFFFLPVSEASSSTPCVAKAPRGSIFAARSAFATGIRSYREAAPRQSPRSTVCRGSIFRDSIGARSSSPSQCRTFGSPELGLALGPIDVDVDVETEERRAENTIDDEISNRGGIGDILVEKDNEKPAAADGDAGRALGILVLLTVPFAWGTYAPAVKYVYELEPAVPGFVFSAGYYAVAATTLALLSNLQSSRQRGDIGDNNVQVSNEELVDLDTEASTVRWGGRELGLYLFVGNGLQVVGLETVPADRSAFLVQLTTVMVPLASAFAAGTASAIPAQTWAACLLAFVGVIVMGADGNTGGNVEGADSIDVDGLFDWEHIASAVHLSNGDTLIVLAAVAYTLHVVRLGEYAPRSTPLKLAAAKATTEACLSAALVLTLWWIGGDDTPSSSLLPSFVVRLGGEVRHYVDAALGSGLDESTFAVVAAAVLWTGWVTCAYTIYAQSFGQSRVNPTDSNLIYTTQPLFSSAFAFVLLGETLGAYGCVGAVLIGAALWLVAFSDDDGGSGGDGDGGSGAL